MNCFLYFYDVNMNENTTTTGETEKRLVPKGAKKTKIRRNVNVELNII